VEINFQEWLKDISDAMGMPVVMPAFATRPDGTSTAVVIKDGYKLVEAPGPLRHKRVHRCNSVRSFGAWLKRHASPRMTEILATSTEIVAALEPADANGDRVTCSLEPHPRAVPWIGMFGQKVNQRQLWLFVRSHFDDFVPAVTKAGENLGSYGKILAQELQKLEVKKGAAIKTELDSAGNVIFAAGEEKMEVQGELPASFEIEIPLIRDVVLGPQDEEPRYRLEVFLQLRMVKTEDGSERPALTLECPGLAMAQIDATDDALECLRETLAKEDDGDFMVGFGTIGLAEYRRAD